MDQRVTAAQWLVIASQTLEPHGLVKDCSCDFQTVNHAATEFFAPLLQQLQER
jgi:hypothetical protein